MVTVTFSEAVTVSGEPRARLDVGGQKRWGRYDRSEQDGTRLVFSYKVKKTDADENGVSAKKNALGLNGGTIADTDGNAARLKSPALPDQPGHKVDGSQKPARGEPVEPPAVQEPVIQEQEREPQPAEPEPVPPDPDREKLRQTPPDTTPPTYSIFSFRRYDPDSGRWLSIQPTTSLTVGVIRLRATITFSEPIDESRTTIRYRVGSGRERTFSFASGGSASGECYPVPPNSYECYYTPTAGESGLFRVRVTAYRDISGNAGRAGSYNTKGITVDNSAPKAPKLVLKNPASSPSNDATPEFTATLSETGGRLWLWPDRANCGDFSGSSSSRPARVDVTDNTAPYTADITARGTAIQSEGSVTFYAMHRNALQNASPCSEGFTYVYDATPPAKPANFNVARGPGYARVHADNRHDTYATLTWDNPNDAGIAKYQYRQKSRYGSFGGWTDIPDSDADTTSHTVTGLATYGDYYYQLRAVDKANNVGSAADANHGPQWLKGGSMEGDYTLSQYIRQPHGGHVFARTRFYDIDDDDLTYKMWCTDCEEGVSATFAEAFVIDDDGRILNTADTRGFFGAPMGPSRNPAFTVCVEASESGGLKLTRCFNMSTSGGPS